MNKLEKDKIIDELKEMLQTAGTIYITDVSGLNAENTSALRRLCFSRNVKMNVVKNTLLKKAMERSGLKFDELFPVLKGSTSVMIADTGNVPAKLIKEFRKKGSIPALKGAWVEEAVFIGDNQIDTLINLKSKNELIGDVIALLQSPAKNVLSALQSGGSTLAGLVKTLQERDN